MNEYLRESIEIANNYDYLDRLYSVYPISNNVRRNINESVLKKLKDAYISQDNSSLIKQALKLELFPLKDSYVAYLKRDETAIEKNPKTINRLAGSMYQLGWEKFLMNISEPKEANRQMGSKFKDWLNRKPLGIMPVPLDQFIADNSDAILDCSDAVAMNFAAENFGYSRNKGLDFIARFNGKYVIGEAKFLTDFGGHQNAQFEDAITTLQTPVKNAVTVAILDGVLFINGRNKMHNSLKNQYANCNIMSALSLSKFCYSLT